MPTAEAIKDKAVGEQLQQNAVCVVNKRCIHRKRALNQCPFTGSGLVAHQAGSACIASRAARACRSKACSMHGYRDWTYLAIVPLHNVGRINVKLLAVILRQTNKG